MGGWTLTDSDGSFYTFDQSGLPLSVRSPLDSKKPAAARYLYDATVSPPRVSQIEDPVSRRVVKLFYGGSGECSTAVAPWEVAPVNMLCKVRYFDDSETRLHYSGGLLAAVEEPGGAITQFGYRQGMLSSVRSVLANDLIRSGHITNPDLATTEIDYVWVQAAVKDKQSVIRPAYQLAQLVDGNYPPGTIPLVAAVTGPSPDGNNAATRPKRSYSYQGVDKTVVTDRGVPVPVATFNYDETGRTLSKQIANNGVLFNKWDDDGKDLIRSVTGPTGRKTSTIYDWADRVSDVFGPAPTACFDSEGFPTADPDCAKMPHTHSGYDTDPSGNRLSGLAVEQYSNLNMSGQPLHRGSAGLSPASWPDSSAGVATRLTGEIAMPVGDHRFSAELVDRVNDGIRVYVKDELLIDRWYTLRQAIKADSPKYYWPLNNASADLGVGDTTLTLTGSPTAFDGGTIGEVDPTTTARFDGSKTLTGSGMFTNLGLNFPTVEIWFKTTKTGVIIGQQNADKTNYARLLYIDNDGKLRGGFFSDKGHPKTLISKQQVIDGMWHHAVLSTVGASSETPASQTLFLDGQLVATENNTVKMEACNLVTIGSGVPVINSQTTGYFTGSLGRFAVYDRPLALDQVARRYLGEKAKLTSNVPVTFRPPPRFALNTLPAPPVATPLKFRVEYRKVSQNSFTLKHVTGGGTLTTVNDNALSTRYGLPTLHKVNDQGGVAGGKLTTATRYNENGLDPHYGLATSTIADPGGLNLISRTRYEPPTSYLRPLAQSEPSTDINNETQTTTTSYYQDTDTNTAPNSCGVNPGTVNQGGLAKRVKAPINSAGQRVSVETIYDKAGRPVAVGQTLTDAAPTEWVCTEYDTRGRTSKVTTPGFSADIGPRVVSTNYAAGGDARITAVTDPTGTITTVTNLLGQLVSYTDTAGVTTTNHYDVTGRLTTQISTDASGTSSSVVMTYRNDGQTETITLDGTLLATMAYAANGELTGVSYPFGQLGSLVKNPAGALIVTPGQSRDGRLAKH